MRWIGAAVSSIRAGAWLDGAYRSPIPNAFENVDVYYVHTAWPEHFPLGKPVQETVTANSKSLTVPTVDELSRWCEDQVIGLLKKMW